MENLLVVVLLAILVFLWVKFGIANILPQHILVLRNVITGELSEKGPGLKIFFPGLYEKFRLVDCRQVILDPPNLLVTSREGQRVEVDYQITLWVDGFFDKGKEENGETVAEKGDIQSGQAIKAVVKIGEQKIIGLEKIVSLEEFKKDIETIGLKESNVAIQNVIGNYLMADLVGKKDFLPVACPFCDKTIEVGQIKCPDPDCEMNKKGMKTPPDFYGRVSFSAGVRLHNRLKDDYGLGCLLKIRNVVYPAEVERAARAQQIAEMEGAATKARLAKETLAFQNLIDQTKVNPNVAFLGSKILEVIPELVAALRGEKKSGQRRSVPGRKKEGTEKTWEEEEE